MVTVYIGLGKICLYCFSVVAQQRRVGLVDGDNGYRSMLPCYYKEKIEEVKECA